MRISGSFLATVALLAATWGASAISANRGGEQLARPLDSIPRQLGEWTASEDRSLDPATEAVLKATAYVSRVYRRNDVPIDFFTAFYSLQEAGEAMHSPRNCLPGSGWEVWKHETVEVSVDGKPVKLNNYGVQNGSQRMIVLYWYQTPERVVASEYYAKMCLVWDALLSSHTSGSIVRLALPDQPESLEAGIDFASRVIPQVQQCLPPSS